MSSNVTIYDEIKCVIWDIGPIALAIYITAAVLFLVWLCLAIRRRRLLPFLGAAVITLIAIGYVIGDWKHISLNLRMRDADTVRADCMELLRKRESIYGNSLMDLWVAGKQLPQSFTRLGAVRARVSTKSVFIDLYVAPYSGRCRGYLYYPQLSIHGPSWSRLVWRTWYRDIYEFVQPGE